MAFGERRGRVFSSAGRAIGTERRDQVVIGPGLLLGQRPPTRSREKQPKLGAKMDGPRDDVLVCATFPRKQQALKRSRDAVSHALAEVRAHGS